MDLSLFLGRFFGLYFVIISLGYFVRKEVVFEAVDDYMNSPGLMLVTGAFTTILGLFLVLSHNVWDMNWRLIVTLLSYIILVKGVLTIFFPASLKKVKEFYMNSLVFNVNLAIWFFLGLYLLYEGFVVAQM